MLSEIQKNLIKIQGAVDILIPAINEAQTLQKEILAMKSPEPVVISPAQLTPGEYPCSEGQVLITCPGGWKITSENFVIVSPEDYLAETAPLKERLVDQKMTRLDRIFNFITNKRSLIGEKIVTEPEFKDYKFRETMYILDKNLYEDRSAVNFEGDKLILKSLRRVDLMRKFLGKNKFINNTIFDEIHVAIKAYNQGPEQRLAYVNTLPETVYYRDWRFEYSEFSFPGVSFSMRDFNKLTPELVTLSEQAGKVLADITNQKTYDEAVKLTPNSRNFISSADR